jgi:hypothetical protein
MTVLIELINNFAIWIYVACALTILVYLRVIYLAKRERGASLFTIEKEVATGKAFRATFTILGLLVIISLVAFVDLYLAPTLGVTVGSSTPEGPVVLPTPTDAPPAPTATATATRGPLVRPTPPWSPTPEQSPTAAIMTAADCPDPMSRISSPVANQTVGGVVEIRGTAKANAFQFYKMEFGFGQPAGEFFVIDDLKYTPVEDGVLVQWNTGDLSGPMTLRLTVVLADGNWLPQCVIPVTVQQG